MREGRGLHALHAAEKEVECLEIDDALYVRDEMENLNQYASEEREEGWGKGPVQKIGSLYWDAVSGEAPSASLTQEARREELTFMDSWDVWDAVNNEPIAVPEELRNATAAERDRAFLEESGFPIDND